MSIDTAKALHLRNTAQNCFAHYAGCTRLDPDNCGACALTQGADAPNYAGWARVYVEAGFALPRRWTRAFCLELQSPNEAYAAALVDSIAYFGLPRFVDEGDDT